MTAPNGPILFNSSTGSDTAASGLGPSTAVTGSGASTTSGSAVVTGIDTTGVSAGDLLWVNTTSGRQFSIIASVDSGTQVTCDDTFSVTAGSRTWAIGGKRATLGGSVRFLDTGSTGDAKGGWILEFQSGHDETIGARIVVRVGGNTTDGPIVVRGESGAATKPILKLSVNSDLFLVNASYFSLRDIDCRNTNATKTASYVIRPNSDSLAGIVVNGLTANHATDKWYRAVGIGGRAMRVSNSSIGNCANSGIHTTVSGGAADIFNNSIFSCGSHGIANDLTFLGINIVENLIYSNSGDGINWTSGTDARDSGRIASNIFWDNIGSGIEIAGANLGLPAILKNIIAENEDYGIKSAAAGNDDAMSQIVDRNAYHANTSGQTSGVSTETNAITLSADPFVDAAAGDFNINNTAGGGADLRATTVVLP